MPTPAGQPAALQAASRRKADEARRRTTDALAKLRKAKTPITFASVAREARVSPRYLYSQPDLVDQIRRLRPVPARTPVPESTPGESGIVSVLRAKIVQQQNKIEDLEETVRRLRHELEIAHGEIIKLHSRRSS